MSSANWSNPVLASLYTDFLSLLKSRDEDLALMFDGTTSTNIPTNTIRWNSTNSRWEKWSGSAWNNLDTDYDINVATVGGNTPAQLLARANHTGTQAVSTLTSVTATAAELNYSDKASALGTSEASKVVTCDASRNVTNINNLSATSFTGALTGNVVGNVTGNVTGSSGSCTGNSATATTAAACSGNSATATTAAACSGNSATATLAANSTLAGGYTPGNLSGNIPVSNGTENTNLNAEIHGGLKVHHGQTSVNVAGSGGTGSASIVATGITTVLGCSVHIKATSALMQEWTGWSATPGGVQMINGSTSGSIGLSTSGRISVGIINDDLSTQLFYIDYVIWGT